MIKAYIPQPLKRFVKSCLTQAKDLSKGYVFRFATSGTEEVTYDRQLEITQNLMPNPAKEQNLRIAMDKINSVPIYPGEIFSFWKVVGNPSAKRGFVGSRSLINGVLEESVGGGLCQLSGLTYFVSLRAGLDILERHNHSVDIYTDEARYTPLGSDATVAYGYKDLRVCNNLNQPVNFYFTIHQDQITVALRHSEVLTGQNISFSAHELTPDSVEVKTWVNGQIFDTSIYKRLPAN